MHIPFRTITVHASALLIAGTSAAACSSAPAGEPAAQTAEQAVNVRPTCGKGYVVVNAGSYDTGPNGQPIESWECEATAALHAGATTTQDADTCGSVAVATPASLPSTCTLGTIIDGQVFFACPAGTVPPASLGLVSAPAGPCSHPAFRSDGEECEEVEVITSLSSNCLGSPATGWEFVADAVGFVWNGDGGSGGSCPGGCAILATPPLNRTVAP